jgi:hypothetical protein
VPERRVLLMWKYADRPEDARMPRYVFHRMRGHPSDVGAAWIVAFAGDERISSEEVAEGQWITRAEARRLAEREGYELAFFDEILVGFDAREAGEHDPRWGEPRRQQFLLRRDVGRPLSVDGGVWPTTFDGPWEEVPLLDGPQGKQIGVSRTLDRSVIGLNAPLWHNLDRMTNGLDEEGADAADRVLVAVGWCWRWNGDASAYPDIWGPHVMAEAEPAEPEQSWTLLGYDVADGSLISGLSNCGYTPGDSDPRIEEARQAAHRLRERWVPKLNEHHLFRDQDPAFAFADVTNTRVPDHAPFHVYSLYRLQ